MGGLAKAGCGCFPIDPFWPGNSITTSDYLAEIANISILRGKPAGLESNLSADDSWFPSDAFKKEWQLFETSSLAIEPTLLNFHSGKLAPIATVNPAALRIPPVYFTEKSSIISLQVAPVNSEYYDVISVLSRSYLSDVIIVKTAEGSYISFRFNALNLPIGQFYGEIPIRFASHGKPVLGGVNVPLSVKIDGDVAASPPSIRDFPFDLVFTVFKWLFPSFS